MNGIFDTEYMYQTNNSIIGKIHLKKDITAKNLVRFKTPHGVKKLITDFIKE